jgi:hypothetical protein
VLLDLGDPGAIEIGPWATRVRIVDAEYGGPWELPVIGAVTAPAAMLIRPDGYIAWVGGGSDRRLTEVVRTGRAESMTVYGPGVFHPGLRRSWSSTGGITPISRIPAAITIT